MPDRRYARNQKLPLGEADHLSTLSGIDLHYRCRALYEAGWTLRAIGEALSPQRGKSTVHAWLISLPLSSPPDSRPVPEVHLVTPEVYVPKKPKAPPVSHADAERLRDLAPSVRRFRAPMSPKHAVAVKVAEFSAICTRLHAAGVPIQELADITDTSYNTIAKRIDLP